ncbi:MAG: right-handed parallel beta-helix repeat-containing protein [Oscillospiraceae bacterium]|nr:right-handed parallel beta-helix repeat-containing protein [Oscillospiraceae bacterium]
MNTRNILKNITALCLTFCVLSSSSVVNAIVQGDINSDEKLDCSDAVIMRDILLGCRTSDNYDTAAADFNNNSKTDIYDYIILKSTILQSRSQTNKIIVSDTQSLMNAVKNASAGDEIIVRPGVYETDTGHTKGSLFIGTADGTKEKPIILRSEDPENKAELKGIDPANRIVLYITGDFWQIEDLKISTAQKGIVLDNSNNSVISGCEVYNTGSEGIHLRDNSSDNIVSDCSVHDNGVVSPSYGEAVYIGSAKSTSGYGYECNNNVISGCKLGPQTAAEHVDIKEYTTGNIVENCIFDGTGMSGANYADSFVDVKGNECIIRNNTGYRNNNSNITEAVQLHVQVEGWGENNIFCNNIFYMDDESSYITKAWSGSVTVYANERYPDGLMYEGDSVIVKD